MIGSKEEKFMVCWNKLKFMNILLNFSVKKIEMKFIVKIKLKLIDWTCGDHELTKSYKNTMIT